MRQLAPRARKELGVHRKDHRRSALASSAPLALGATEKVWALCGTAVDAQQGLGRLPLVPQQTRCARLAPPALGAVSTARPRSITASPVHKARGAICRVLRGSPLAWLVRRARGATKVVHTVPTLVLAAQRALTNRPGGRPASRFATVAHRVRSVRVARTSVVLARRGRGVQALALRTARPAQRILGPARRVLRA